MSPLMRMPGKACSTTRIREVVSPASPGVGLSHLYLGFVNLEQAERRGFDFGPLNTVVVVMEGSVEMQWEDADGRMKHEIAEGRHDVFDGLPWAICARPYTTVFLKGLSAGAELALIRAELVAEDAEDRVVQLPEPGAEVISPRGVRVSTCGTGSRARQVRQVASVECRARRDGRETRRLVVGETLISAGIGHDASLLHADDSMNGEVPVCEEVRHFRFRSQQGVAIQRVCSPSRNYDHSYRVQHGDTVVVPSGLGSHVPTCDCDLFFLWAQAGAVTSEA
ncbi:MAG: 5-deoxy-glucuronate isomerase [Bacillota bacterium]|jgi:5-deoxy-D-glucuronate isomerase